MPEATVIAVRTADASPPAYAEAFGKLVGYYAQPGSGVKVVFPQQSITLDGVHYAAIGTSNAVSPPQGIERLTLPRCKFISARYTGNYEGIGPAIETLVGKALGKHLQIQPACGIRIHHLNSPDNTPAEKLEHVLFVPVASRTP